MREQIHPYNVAPLLGLLGAIGAISLAPIWGGDVQTVRPFIGAFITLYSAYIIAAIGLYRLDATRRLKIQGYVLLFIWFGVAHMGYFNAKPLTVIDMVFLVMVAIVPCGVITTPEVDKSGV